MMGKEQVSPPAGDLLAESCLQKDIAQGDAGSFLRPSLVDVEVDRCECRSDPDDLVAEIPHPWVAVPRCPGARVRTAAHTDDYARTLENFSGRFYAGNSAGLVQKTLYGGGEAKIDSCLLEILAEDGDDIFGSLMDGEDASIRPSVDIESARREHAHDLAVGEAVASGANELRFIGPELSEDVLHLAIVGDVALSAAGDQDLRADPNILFNERYAGPQGGRSPRCDDSRGACADYDDIGLHAFRDVNGTLFALPSFRRELRRVSERWLFWWILNKRFSASYKIAVGFVALALLAVYGSRYVNEYLLGREHFPKLTPGVVNVVGVNTDRGYGILVQNRTAKLAYGDKVKFGPEEGERSLEDSGAQRKFIPIKEMLRGLQGDIAGLSYLIQRLNDISDDSLPADAPVWKLEDIEKALAGDPRLKPKLIQHLNVNLDGTPLDRVSINALYNGIVVDCPVPVEIDIGDERKTVVARVKQPYRPAFIAAVENQLRGKFANKEIIATEYSLAAAQLKEGRLVKEDVGSRLLQLGRRAKDLAEFPQQVLDSITPVINENHILGATYSGEDTTKGKRYTLALQLNEEGKKRLWQYTKDRVNSQLLVTVNGVAIAAPYIAHAISSGEIQVHGLEEESLLEELVDTIKNTKRATTSQ